MRRVLLALFILCLPSITAAPAQELQFGPWQPLFNGRDTRGWTQAKIRGQTYHRWEAVDGALTNAIDPGMDLCTEREFEDYELELEYRLPPARGNSGVFLRGQIEVQLRQRTARLSESSSGAIFGRHAPRSDPQNGPGEWNHLRVVHIGNEITVWLNGVQIQERLRVEGHTPAAMLESVAPDRRGEPLDLAGGPIMLQGDRSQVWFRNIRIRLKETNAAL